VAAIRLLFRFLSIVFHLFLALFLIGISGVALLSGLRSLQLGMLPWTGSTLVNAVFFGALFGLLTIILAVLGKLRFLFFLYSLAVAWLMVKGYFLSGYRFAPGEARIALYLTIGSLVGILGAWFQMWGGAKGKRSY
jgi:hypothetical protein